jgi:hypothetical protein
MKTTVNTPPPATPDFPGIVIDPESGRKCALQVDIFHGLKLSGGQVAACKARVYQGRYYDVEDVIEARRQMEAERQARRNRGMILTEVATIMTTIVAGTALAATILAMSYQDTGGTLRKAVEHRDSTIAELGFSPALETINTEGE